MEMKSKNLTQIITEESKKVEKYWKKYLLKTFTSKYDFFYSQNLLGLFMLIFIKKNLK